MARLPAAILAATVAAGCGTAAYAQDATVQKTAGQPSAEELQLKIEELQAQVKRLAEETAAIKENPEPQAKPASGGTTYQFGGFVKMDSAISDYSDGTNATAGIGEDFLVASTIPVGGESGDAKFHAHAKTSRLFFKSSTDLGGGSAVKTHIEIDAIASGQGDERISNSYSQRLRHAFVDWQIDANRSLLAGQSWSTFFNVGALPEGMDFVGPVGTIFERQPQLRYTHKIGSGSIQIAAENPATTLYNGTQNPYDDNSSPDIVLRYNNSLGGLNYSVASMSRELAYEVGTDRESKRGYAISLSGKYQFGKDDIRFMYNYGNAIGRYMGLNAFRGGAIDASGDID
ncbi:DcaP family trimeric outer membrane transporter, partial [Biformimicrobium ophioploci]|uniref:DcaP family trimeric outer membrane transporter n=1 Tax=Biformimicrobium ophioploci TaxID=3036711 RepID=UPI00255799CD